MTWADLYRIIGCGVYYYLWIWAIPKLRGYRIRQETVKFEDGAQSHRLVKVPVAEVTEWDATHDAVGRLLSSVGESASVNADGVDEKVGEVVGKSRVVGVREASDSV